MAYAVLRFLMAWTVGVWGVEDEVLQKKLCLVPIRDAFYFVTWLASFASNRIRWGSAEYRVRAGQMVAVLADKPAETKRVSPTPR